MFDYFDTQVSKRITEAGSSTSINLEISRSPDAIQKPVIIADVAMGLRLGRITLWASGECDSEIIDTEGNYVFWKNTIVTTEDGLDALFDNFFKEFLID
jgi:hypothetical protein